MAVRVTVCPMQCVAFEQNTKTRKPVRRLKIVTSRRLWTDLYHIWNIASCIIQKKLFKQVQPKQYTRMRDSTITYGCPSFSQTINVVFAK